MTIDIEENISSSLTEIVDGLESSWLEDGAEVIGKEIVETSQGLPVALLEISIEDVVVTRLVYLSDDGIAVSINYVFPVGLLEAGRELAYYSFGTFRVN